MSLSKGSIKLTRRGFLALGALGTTALTFPRWAFALDGIPVDEVSGNLANIVIEPIENGWRVSDVSTGEVGAVVFPNGGWDSIVTMPDGEVIVTRWNDDGTVMQNGVVIGGPEPHITPFASIPDGYDYHITIHYDFSGLTIAEITLQLIATNMDPVSRESTIGKLIQVGAIVAGVAANVTMDMSQYIDWDTGLFYNHYEIYYNGGLITDTIQGPLSSTRP